MDGTRDAVPAARTVPDHATDGNAVLPAVVGDVELSAPLPRIAPVTTDGRRIANAWLLVRLFTEPIGRVEVPVPDDGLTPEDVARAIGAGLARTVDARLAGTGLTIMDVLADNTVLHKVRSTFLAERARILAHGPEITVVVCTREQPEGLARCLDSLLAQEYPRFRILVVDNAPRTDATARVVRAAAARGPVEYLLEPRPGLSRARNRAIAVAGDRILAFTDDDVVADPHWLAEVARAFAAHPEADAVTGLIVPAEFETRAQYWFEGYGGHSKGRGFDGAVFGPRTRRTFNALYPLPPFGTGANMTFRAGVLNRIGGFDTALGAGTVAMGSEDTHAFTRLLRAGGTIAYQPSALVRHRHRATFDALRRQLHGYGCGLTAAYTALVLESPGVLFGLLRLVPTALRDLFGKNSARTADLDPEFPRDLLRENVRGLIRGPFAYLRGRRAQRREERT